MKVDVMEQKVKYVTDEGSAQIELHVQILDNENKPKINQALFVKENSEVLFDTDTTPEGVAVIEMIVNIMQDTRKNLQFVAGRGIER